MTYQDALNYVKEQKISSAQKNILIVHLMTVRVIEGKIPSEVRKALNDAVKNKEIGHVKKDGLKPEIYHHKNARPLALETQERIQKESIERIKRAFA